MSWGLYFAYFGCFISVSCVSLPSETAPLLEKGTASWYGKKFQGQLTASGEPYNMKKFTAAHRTLPFGKRVIVRSLTSGKTVTVRINDRGPFRSTRIIDLSYAAASELGLLHKGEDQVTISVE